MKSGKTLKPDNLHPDFSDASAQSVPHMVDHTVLYMPHLKKSAQNQEIFKDCYYPEAE